MDQEDNVENNNIEVLEDNDNDINQINEKFEDKDLLGKYYIENMGNEELNLNFEGIVD